MIKTPDYIQIAGFIDQTQINLTPDDYGGELDPHGADLVRTRSADMWDWLTQLYSVATLWVVLCTRMLSREATGTTTLTSKSLIGPSESWFLYTTSASHPLAASWVGTLSVSRSATPPERTHPHTARTSTTASAVHTMHPTTPRTVRSRCAMATT